MRSRLIADRSVDVQRFTSRMVDDLTRTENTLLPFSAADEAAELLVPCAKACLFAVSLFASTVSCDCMHKQSDHVLHSSSTLDAGKAKLGCSMSQKRVAGSEVPRHVGIGDADFGTAPA